MTDKEHIEQAYGSLLEKIFDNFFDSFTRAQGDATAEAAAENKYKANVAHARFIRDRALALL